MLAHLLGKRHLRKAFPERTPGARLAFRDIEGNPEGKPETATGNGRNAPKWIVIVGVAACWEAAVVRRTHIVHFAVDTVDTR